MKKVISLFLGICILVMNCVVPMAAEEAVEIKNDGSKVVFYGDEDKTTEITEITIAPYSYNTVYYSISGDNVDTSNFNWYSTDLLDVGTDNYTCTIFTKYRYRTGSYNC